jgi:hypothetical protein
MLAQRYLSKLSEWSCELSTNGRWKGEGECVRDVSESVEVWGGGGLQRQPCTHHIIRFLLKPAASQHWKYKYDTTYTSL